MNTRTVFLIALFTFAAAQASVPKLQLQKPHKLGESVREGFIVGGMAGDEFSLLKFQRSDRPGGVERWTLTYGDRAGARLHGPPGYFHLQLDPGSKRLILDLAQVNRTAVDQKDLAKLFLDSRVVAASSMSMDPQDQSTSLVFLLKAPLEIHIEKDLGSGQLVIDLKPIISGEIPL